MSWPVVEMGRLCTIESGASNTIDSVLEGPYHFFDRSKTVKRSNRYLYDCEALIIPGEGKEFLPTYFVGKFDLHQRAYALFDFIGIEAEYLAYYLEHRRDYLPSVAVGATVKSLRRRHFEQLPVSLAPLAEQRRIVAVLDEAFDGIATATAIAEENLANARELFQVGADSRFDEANDRWPAANLWTLCDFFTDGDWIESKDQSESGIRLIQTGNVGNGAFKNRAEKARHISEATFQRLRCTEIFSGDLLISRLPDPVGRSCIVPDVGKRMITAVDCTIVRLNGDRMLPEFLSFYTRCRDYGRQVQQLVTGTTRSRISRGNLGKISVPCPPLDQQTAIVGELGELSEEVAALREVYERKLALLAELKQSILHRAFNGDLTPAEALAA